MLVVHLSLSPLAGAPIRLVNALNKHTNIEARLINFNPQCYGSRTFPEDLSWNDNREECISLIKNADIIHLHHFINVSDSDNPFQFNFSEAVKKNCKFIRHFHSDLAYVSGKRFKKAKQILEDKFTKLVIPHYPERTFLSATIVPNIVPIHDEIFMPKQTTNKKIKVFYSSSTKASRWDDRWQTKGWPEVTDVLKKLSKELEFEYIEAYGIPYKECQSLKQSADIVIGDLVTGSYHLTELEALAQGKTVICNPDPRTLLTLSNLTGCKDFPFVISNLQSLPEVLRYLIQNPELLKNIGKFGRKWMEDYYDDKILIQQYVKIYNDITDGKTLFRNGHNQDADVKDFLYNKLYDLVYYAEMKRSIDLHKIKTKYLRYKILSKITFGKTRKKYKQKKKELKAKLKTIKKLMSQITF